MCGRFTQYRSRDEYFEELGLTDEKLTHDPAPIGRYNVAPGTRVLLLNQRDGHYHLDPVHWGYAPIWWQKQPLINAKSETAATGKMFKPLWNGGRAIVMADGWYEWARKGNEKQPYFIQHKNRRPIFFAAIGKEPFNKGNEDEGFVIVTAASEKGLVDIHDRRPLVLTPDAAIAWMNEDADGDEASEIANDGSVDSEEFIWHPVTKAVGNVRNQDASLIEEINDPVV